MRFWKRKEHDLENELCAHFAMAVRERMERGEDRATAEREARKEFGSQALARESVREVWGGQWLARLSQDARYACRGLRHSPGFASVAIVSLALGIGANTAIFTLMHAMLFRPLPVDKPDELVQLLQQYPGEPRMNGNWTVPSLHHFREHGKAFRILAGTSTDDRAMVRVGNGEVEAVSSEHVTGAYFAALGLRPALGRLIGPRDQGDAAVISGALWESKFARDPAAVGRTIVVDGRAYTILGVAPRAFEGMRMGRRTKVWVLRDPALQTRMAVIGRLRDGVTLARAQAEMESLFRFTLDELTKGSRDQQWRKATVQVDWTGRGSQQLRDRYGRPLAILMTVVAVLLAIACINLASMMLARAAARRREMAVRAGLGASRWRLMQQTMTESLLLAGIGSAAGIVVAHAATAALVKIIGSGRQHERYDLFHVQPDAASMLFAAFVAVVAACVFGLAPAWYAFHSSPARALRQAGSALESRWGGLFGKGLVAAQVGASVVLLGAAALFAGYLEQLRSRDLGFDRENVILMRVDHGRAMQRPEAARRTKELLARVGAIASVRAASVSGATPIQGAGASRMVTVEGFTERPEDRRYVALNWVGPQYFQVLGTPLLQGRDFRYGDEGQTMVVIVNRSFAAHFVPGGNALGKRVRVDGDPVAYEIAGVVGDAKYTELKEAAPRTVYFNTFQTRFLASQFVVRTAAAPERIMGTVRRLALETLPGANVEETLTMEDQVDAAVVPERLIARLSGLFGALGALIAAVGLYGLLAYNVARRTSEIGVRMALGATEGRVYRMIMSQALGITCAGVLAGLALAYAGRKVAVSLIAELPVDNPAPLFWGVLVMLALTLFASFVPARRAARIDPAQALRGE